MMQEATLTSPSELRDAWRQLQNAPRPTRQRDAASRFGVSEAELVASQCGDGVTRLQPRFLDIIRSLESLGPVMALTRNEYIVIEKDGHYRNIETFGPMGQVVDEGIDLRLFFSRWRFGFSMIRDTPNGRRYSLQFFDASGTAVHKVFLREHSDIDVFHRLVTSFTADSQDPALATEEIASSTTVADHEVDVAAMRAEWLAMTNTHQFFRMLQKHRVGRLQALRLAGLDLAREVSANDSLHRVLHGVSGAGLDIMIFVGNRGCIEIHSGIVNRVVAKHGWLNVLDPGFNLHAREDGIAGAWVVRKPSEHGVITSLEIFDPDGENIALLFANRKSGTRMVERWDQLVRGLE